MNNKQLDMVLDYLNEGTEIDIDEFLNEANSKRKPKIVYKDSFKNTEKRKSIEKEVNKEVEKILKNEEKLIGEIYKKMRGEIHKENWIDVYFDEIEVDDPEDPKDKFDIWAYTSREQFGAKIKNGKILKIDYFS